MGPERLQNVLNGTRFEAFDDVSLPIWPTLELGLCGGMLKNSGSRDSSRESSRDSSSRDSSSGKKSIKVKFVGWNVIDVEMANNTIGNHRDLYEHMKTSIEFLNPSASENMASVLGLDPTFSMFDVMQTSSPSDTPVKYYETVNTIQSRSWSMNRIKMGNDDSKKLRFEQKPNTYLKK